jgi:hypothetical protein
MKISRVWAMPNHNTFSIKPIREMIEMHMAMQSIRHTLLKHRGWIDPFSRNSPFGDRTTTNDLNPQFEADYHLEALDFFKKFEDDSVSGVLFDPPYSPRQISECYKGVGREVHMRDTQASFYSDRKDAAARVLMPGGLAICLGWNSQGLGVNRKFEMIEIMLVAHGGAHNDTIVTVERKLPKEQSLAL